MMGMVACHLRGRDRSLPRAIRLVVVVALLVTAAACSTVSLSGDPRSDGGTAPTTEGPAGTGPSEATRTGPCHEVIAELHPDEAGYAKPQQAADAFIRQGAADSTVAGQSLRGAEVVDGKILLDGEEIGEVHMGRPPAGGFDVASAWWCPPPQ